MTQAWQPWQRLLPIWLPAVALFVISGSFYAWQTSDSVGRAAKIRSDVENLSAEIDRLERIREQAEGERVEVAELNAQFEHL